MMQLLAFFFRVAPRPHDETVRANQFSDTAPFSPYTAMLPFGVSENARR